MSETIKFSSPVPKKFSENKDKKQNNRANSQSDYKKYMNSQSVTSRKESHSPILISYDDLDSSEENYTVKNEKETAESESEVIEEKQIRDVLDYSMDVGIDVVGFRYEMIEEDLGSVVEYLEKRLEFLRGKTVRLRGKLEFETNEMLRMMVKAKKKQEREEM